ncbi:hypothetical protein F2Q70_00044897, partial [Brassica cretica]
LRPKSQRADMAESLPGPNVFSLRIVSIDYYMASPIPAYDLCYSSFQGGEVKEVPVIRVYVDGIIPAVSLDLEKALKMNTLGVSSYSLDLDVLQDFNQILQTPNGVMYEPPEVRRGILPRLLEEILSTRIMVKKAMKKLTPSEAVLGRIFNARQLALKLIANVTYGYTAAGFSGRMPCAELADSIVQCGRSTLEKAISVVNANENWNARVVYGDTDSMFVLLKGRTVKEAFDIGQEIASGITEMNPYPVTLKMEKVYQPCFLLTKKRYVGYSYESPDQNKPTFDAKGIETVRRDTCEAVAKTMEQLSRTCIDSGNGYYKGECLFKILSLQKKFGWGLILIVLQLQNQLETHYSGFKTPHIYNLSDLVQRNLALQARKFGRLQLSDTSEDSSNIYVFQISGKLPFTIDIPFVSGSRGESSNVEKRLTSLTGLPLSDLLRKKHREFDAKFTECFNISEEHDSETVRVGKTAMANMIGGIGYFYGQSKIYVPKSSQASISVMFIMYQFFLPFYVIPICKLAELYTAVPSRPFFPRGFLWDEGFHQLLIWRWDFRITLDIVGHWLDLLNIDGWIPREQILGAEALSKVPEEFVVQYPSNGNPPTLFLVIRDLIDGIKTEKFIASEKDEILSFLERASVRLDAWFQWFNTFQTGKERGSYFWHGRDNTTTRELNPKTLSSGLDDYPRASHPSEDERHVDLRCWMYLAADCMHSITELLGKEDKFSKEDYNSTAMLLSNFDILNQMHYDKEHGAYFDFGNHTEKNKKNQKYDFRARELKQVTMAAANGRKRLQKRFDETCEETL